MVLRSSFSHNHDWGNDVGLHRVPEDKGFFPYVVCRGDLHNTIYIGDYLACSYGDECVNLVAHACGNCGSTLSA